jgi:hypothetical protein
MSLISTILEPRTNPSTPPKYTALNGWIYLTIGVVLILWPRAVQTLFRDRPFLGSEQGLVRALGLAVVVIGWLPFWRASRQPPRGRCKCDRPMDFRATP